MLLPGVIRAARRNFENSKESNRHGASRHASDTLSSMCSLAVSYQDLGRYQEARDLHLENLGNRKRVLGLDHPETLWSMFCLAVSYQDLGRHQAAEELHAETMRIRKRVLGEKHPDTLWSMICLAVSIQNLGRYQEARELHAETLSVRKRLFGPEHPDTLCSVISLAELYESLGQQKEGGELHAENMTMLGLEEWPARIKHMQHVNLVRRSITGSGGGTVACRDFEQLKPWIELEEPIVMRSWMPQKLIATTNRIRRISEIFPRKYRFTREYKAEGQFQKSL